jgi:hypothetical protein
MAATKRIAARPRAAPLGRRSRRPVTTKRSAQYEGRPGRLLVPGGDDPPVTRGRRRHRVVAGRASRWPCRAAQAAPAAGWRRTIGGQASGRQASAGRDGAHEVARRGTGSDGAGAGWDGGSCVALAPQPWLERAHRGRVRPQRRAQVRGADHSSGRDHLPWRRRRRHSKRLGPQGGGLLREPGRGCRRLTYGAPG